jgi:hypothetical protein
MEAIAILWLTCAVAAGLVYGYRSRRATGFISGLATVVLLGPIGLVLALTERVPQRSGEGASNRDT